MSPQCSRSHKYGKFPESSRSLVLPGLCSEGIKFCSPVIHSPAQLISHAKQLGIDCSSPASKRGPLSSRCTAPPHGAGTCATRAARGSRPSGACASTHSASTTEGHDAAASLRRGMMISSEITKGIGCPQWNDGAHVPGSFKKRLSGRTGCMCKG